MIFQQGNWRSHLAKMAIDDLKSIIQEVWCKLSFETINKPIVSFEQKLHYLMEKRRETLFSDVLKQVVQQYEQTEEIIFKNSKK